MNKTCSEYAAVKGMRCVAYGLWCFTARHDTAWHGTALMSFEVKRCEMCMRLNGD